VRASSASRLAPKVLLLLLSECAAREQSKKKVENMRYSSFLRIIILKKDY
jgi:hypothetical protein